MAAGTSFSHARRSDDLFFGGMAAVIIALVFAGFARTFYLSADFHGPSLTPLRIAHGIAFSAWVLLFALQTSLVAAGRTDLHRRIGIGGAVLAGIMVILGTTLAIASARQGHAPDHLDPRVFLAVPLFDMLAFPALVGAALYFRSRPDAHKRLMFLATASLTAAAVARLPISLAAAGPLFYFGVVDLLAIAGVVYDAARRRAVHPAFVWGGLFLLGSQVLRLAVSRTPAWLAFAGMLGVGVR
jgi:hypothetical protein